MLSSIESRPTWERDSKFWAGGPVPSRTRLLFLAALLAAFAVFYPYLSDKGYCGDSGCPQLSQVHAPSFVELPAGEVTTLLGALLAPALATCSRRRPASDRRPPEVYLSPETDPPRL